MIKIYFYNNDCNCDDYCSRLRNHDRKNLKAERNFRMGMTALIILKSAIENADKIALLINQITQFRNRNFRKRIYQYLS